MTPVRCFITVPATSKPISNIPRGCTNQYLDYNSKAGLKHKGRKGGGEGEGIFV